MYFHETGEVVIENRGARMCPWAQSVLPIGYGQYGIGWKFQVKAGVADNLPIPVLMGTDT